MDFSVHLFSLLATAANSLSSLCCNPFVSSLLLLLSVRSCFSSWFSYCIPSVPFLPLLSCSPPIHVAFLFKSLFSLLFSALFFCFFFCALLSALLCFVFSFLFCSHVLPLAPSPQHSWLSLSLTCHCPWSFSLLLLPCSSPSFRSRPLFWMLVKISKQTCFLIKNSRYMCRSRVKPGLTLWFLEILDNGS